MLIWIDVMRNEPLVSVIICFLNTENFIEEAIESVLAQTYTSWELVLVDDGSTDKSTGIALDYAKRYPDKIFYLEHEEHRNKGISTSRNLGIRNAKGNYIAPLDADDIWLSNKLQEQVRIMESNPEIGMVYGNTKYWFNWIKNTEGTEKEFNLHDKMWSNALKLNTIIKPPTLLILAMSGKIWTALPSSIMFRKEVAEKVGGFEDIFTGMHEDQAFLAKVCLGTPVYVADSCWDLYRQHSESCYNLSLSRGHKRSRELFYLSWLEKYLAKEGEDNQLLLKAIQQKTFRYKYPILYRAAMQILSLKNNIKRKIRKVVELNLPHNLRYKIFSRLDRQEYKPPIKRIHFGEFRRLQPISESWGEKRGLPIDRYYIEKFLEANSTCIKGEVLEIGDDYYTKKYGGEKVTKNDVLNIVKDVHPSTTIVADLASAQHIPSDSFDCIIFTQTLMLIYDMHSAIATLYRILKPGGVILATIGGISQTDDYNFWEKNWCWRFTSVSAEKLFKEKFPPDKVFVQGFGNVLVAISLLHGLVTEDLEKEELDYCDNKYEILITIRAEKPNNESIEQ